MFYDMGSIKDITISLYIVEVLLNWPNFKVRLEQRLKNTMRSAQVMQEFDAKIETFLTIF